MSTTGRRPFWIIHAADLLAKGGERLQQPPSRREKILPKRWRCESVGVTSARWSCLSQDRRCQIQQICIRTCSYGSHCIMQSFHCLLVTSIASCLGFWSLSQTLWDKPLFSIFNNLAKQMAACLPAFPATCGNLFLLCRTFLLGYFFVAGAILLLLQGFWRDNFQVHIHVSKVFWWKLFFFLLFPLSIECSCPRADKESSQSRHSTWQSLWHKTLDSQRLTL